MTGLFLLLLQSVTPPIVHVYAPARIDLEPAARTPGGVTVAGHLLDDDTGEGLSARPISIEVYELGAAAWPHRAGTLTRPDGSFSVRLALPPGPFRILASFAGDGAMSAAHGEQTIDLEKRPLDLKVEGPERLRRGERATFRVMAASDGVPVDVELSMAGAPLRLRDGATEVTLVAHGRGPQKFEVDYPGGPDFDSAHAELRYVVEVPVTLTLAAQSSGPLRRGERLELVGTIADADGPLGLASVEIRALGQPIAVAQADATGAFAVRVPTRSLPAGRLEVDALYRPTASWHAPARARPLAITLVEPEPPPLLAFVLPALATALALLSRRALRWLRARPVRAAAPAPVATERPTRGLARKTARSRVRGDRGFDGVVLDLRTGRPIGGAELWVGDTHLVLDDAGRFALEPPAGAHEVRVRAPEYLDERFTIELPHRGELRGVEIRLCPIRLRVLEEFRAACGDPEGFDHRTPRELGVMGSDPVRELAMLVEETSYSGRELSTDDAERAHELRQRSLA